MKKTGIIIGLLLVCGFFCLFTAQPADANNVQVSNVQLLNSDQGYHMIVKFRLSQDNPFGDLTYDGQPYSDYVWVFVKFAVLKADGTVDDTIGYKHATLSPSASGIGAYNMATGEGISRFDSKGAFIKASNIGAAGKDFLLDWWYIMDYYKSGQPLKSTDKVIVRVCAIEMVKVPTGSFWYGAGNPSNAGTASDNYNPATPVQTIPYQGSQVGYEITSVSQTPGSPAYASSWPNGYSSFYLMKYEISQGQYADFLNMIPATEAVNRFAAQTTSEYAITKDDLKPYGQRYSVLAPQRGCNYLSWDDCMAYAAWVGLRPMTEMEFEKAARGTSTALNPKASYPWGNTSPANEDNPLYIPGGHNYPYNAFQYYMNYQDENNNAENEDGPTNVGLYVSGDITPARTAEQTGASPYGIADLAGNLWEQVINCQSSSVPKNGDGNLHTNYSTDLKWPTATLGSGMRGGGWEGNTWNCLISNRAAATMSTSARNSCRGFRGARTP